MSYGNTSTGNLQCDCCGHVGQDSTPGIYYMELFYTHKCGSCEGDTLLCSDCTGKSNPSSEHIDGMWRTECKSCVRDRKIDKIVDGKN